MIFLAFESNSVVLSEGAQKYLFPLRCLNPYEAC